MKERSTKYESQAINVFYRCANPSTLLYTIEKAISIISLQAACHADSAVYMTNLLNCLCLSYYFYLLFTLLPSPQVVSDFDMTLSRYNVDGKRGDTSHGMALAFG